ncbi:diaminopimelate epimerase [Pullulanibacillus sp. KACC 23026]|uniref:diaminopimelate epimerase n=1 Tax=Pullulanibacillus sp. KACC 23026 TaxID=3028315 RepID=UPI0023B0A753|nr:diaminopimelate epimerase [Pullulanibacillus sp. KACC 23026]WEG13783.1 diaminopimelate epimerase [Pullulanibacillus sp. KACC 23026]
MGQPVTFTKMHGLGNCYIYLDGFKETFDESLFPNWAVQMSNPHTGIGSDGLIAILPSVQGAAKMRIFNKDGSEGKNCGNGLRCVARYLFEKGYVEQAQFPIETASGMVMAVIHEKHGEVVSVTVNMGQPILEPEQIPMVTSVKTPVINQSFPILGDAYSLTAVSMGNPHAILLVDDITHAPIHKLGPELADGHELFPEGVNVGFVEWQGPNEARYRVWERGSAITQACGTGACAAAVALILNQKAKKDESILLHLDGGDLNVKWESETGNVLMTGPATTICDGIFYTY